MPVAAAARAARAELTSPSDWPYDGARLADRSDQSAGAMAFDHEMQQYTPLQERTFFDDMRPAGLNPDGYIDLDSIARDVRWHAGNGYMDRLIDGGTIVAHGPVGYAFGVLGRYQ
jgi:hypothetical protein